ncbi:uncharacterized protein LY89DRAFT_679505 [Mollisia scopiformis]|uniref:DUF7707 domain-containing protein n=1 Tax=Mollisia scopiformis TaxID=149040 RepID=A0A194XX35_MOLSC|nr:uncharacterized protein LY89DRAFT_679505 [Mollisia scopiformis]KUJ24347.1 hypothetical protein LY89DRAFT_679505 [Mollisia scopiformis]
MLSLQASVGVLAVILLSLKVHSQAVYQIDPNSVPLSDRTSWCQSQMTSCPLLCLQLPGESSTTDANDCDPTTLTYDCVCGNGMSPNASEYSQTLPYFICTEYGNQCVAACGGDTNCQSNCRSQHPCGAQDPTRVNVTTTSSTMTATTVPAGATSGTAGVVYTGFGGGAAATTTPSSSSTKSGAQAALDLGRSYSLVVVFAGIFAGFALVM